MLQTCVWSHGLRIKRHDRLVESLAKSLIKRSTRPKSNRESRSEIHSANQIWWLGRGTPAMCWTRKSAQITQTDFPRYHETKACRYDIGPVRNYAESKIPIGERKVLADGGTEGIRTVVQGLIIDWRGCWSKQTYDFLRTELRFPVSYLNLLSVKTLTAGRLIWNTLRRRTD
jgi:hypothetical protein